MDLKPDPGAGADAASREARHVHECSFGDIRTGVISAGELHYMPPFAEGTEWITPDTEIDSDGLAAIGVNSLYAEVGDAVVMIDPSTFAPDEELPRARLVQTPGIDSGLAALTVDPADVTHVLVTHLHSDHLNGLLTETGGPRFPNAEHLVPELDWQAYVVEDGGAEGPELKRFLEPIEGAGLLQRVAPGHVVTDRVRFEHTGGESPGHQAVRLLAETGSLVYLGDLVHFPVEIAHIGRIGVRGRDAAALREARARLLWPPANEHSTFLFTHARFPGWGTVESRPGGMYWRYLIQSSTDRLLDTAIDDD